MDRPTELLARIFENLTTEKNFDKFSKYIYFFNRLSKKLEYML